MQQGIIDGVTQVLQEFLEQEVTIKLGRAKRCPRWITSQPRPIDLQCCEHDVGAQFAILEKYQRFWLDAPQRAIFGSGLSRSLRQRENGLGRHLRSTRRIAHHQ